MNGKEFFRAIAALLFPERCPFCDEIHIGGGACEACEKECVPCNVQRSLPVPIDWGSCRCVASYAYEGKVREAIARFKFRGRRDYAPSLGAALARTLRQNVDLCGVTLVPVPVSKRRMRERGYNQAFLLAREAARELGIPCEEILEKIVDNQPQHQLRRQERLKNTKNVYRMKTGKAIKGPVILIDDIMTTGSTLAECVKTVRAAGIEVCCCAALATKLRSDSDVVGKTAKL